MVMAAKSFFKCLPPGRFIEMGLTKEWKRQPPVLNVENVRHVVPIIFPSEKC
jgi:hypothetical protein